MNHPPKTKKLTPQDYTKHYFVENERIASKIGSGGFGTQLHAVCNAAANFYAKRDSNYMHIKKIVNCLNIDLENLKTDILGNLDSLQPPAIETKIYFSHPDHLGSANWISTSTGRPSQHMCYLPFGEQLVTESSMSFENRYTFSGKERDTETGYSYFGARYYNSDLSIWLSVDPMADKYPGLSSYTYCANNPVILKDPDGRDYEVVVDEEHKTITISATYYTKKDNKGKLQAGLDMWNHQSGMYSYKTGKGKNKQSYTINFNLKIIEDEFISDEQAESSFRSDKSGRANYVEFSNPGGKGACTYGKIIQVNPGSGTTNTIEHEVGHSIGISHWTAGLMCTYGNSEKIYTRNIRQLMNRAGYGKPVEATSFYNNPVTTNLEHIGKAKINPNSLGKEGKVW